MGRLFPFWEGAPNGKGTGINMKIAGLDIGTTGCKLTVFDERGVRLDAAYRDYPVWRTAGEHEVDAAAILDGVYGVTGSLAERYPDIAGIGITSFGETFVAADEEGNPLHMAMLYTDPRGSDQCAELVKRLGSSRIAEISGVNPHEMYSLPKLMWLKENLPEVYDKTKHVFLMEDYVVFALTHTAQIDYSLASRTMGFDIHKLCWSDEIFAAAGIDPALMSRPVPAGTAAGRLTSCAAVRTGLSPDTIVVSVGHDQVAAAIGAGVFASGAAVDGAGTVECITPVYDGIPDMRVMTAGNYAVVPYAIPGKYVCYAFSYTGGALVQWFTETLAKKEMDFAASAGISVNEYLERESDSPTGLLVLPHFAGAATPYMDTGSKGAFVGMTAATTTADLYRGCLEGVVYEMMLNLECLAPSGIHLSMLYATGGGARSKVWMQMKADALNLPVTALSTADAGTVGSAMLTGIAAGCFRDLDDAASVMVKKAESYWPRTEYHERYRQVFERYKRLYQAVRPLV